MQSRPRPIRRPFRRPAVPPRGARALMLARLALGWERLWPALWPAAGVAGLFLVLAWLGLFTLVPGWLHLLLLLGFGAALGILGWRHLRGWRLPTPEEARRRLERDSALAHRPLTRIDDALAGGAGDPLAHALWRIAQDQARRQVSALHVAAPHPNLAARDPWALRAALGLLLVVGATLSWGDLGGRLAGALTPSLRLGGMATPAQLDVWVTPPDYTGLPPIFLTRHAGDAAAADGRPAPVSIPTGSTVLARITGGRGDPLLQANGGETPFAEAGSESWQISQPLTRGDRITIRQGGRTVQDWPVRIVPDDAPAIAFRNPPAVTERQSVRLDYTAADDYGLTKVTATVRLAVEAPDTLDPTPISLPLSLPGRSPKEANASGYQDLTGHPWAGLPVTVQLEATDAAGQTGRSDSTTMTLPERRFTHPVARAIVQQRKGLILGGDTMREPVARALNELSLRPDAYSGDLSVFLSLRSAVNRLMLDKEKTAIPSLLQQLWDTALRLEDGNLSMAERALRDAQQNLMEALDRNASDQELAQLMQELQQAMDQFMDAMEQQMRQAMENGQMPPELPPDAQAMDRQDLQQMIEQMRRMAESGNRDAARQMLSQLRQMMENLQNGQTPDQQQAQGAQQMMEMMEQLQSLSQQQQQLMDQTFQEAQRQGDEQQQGGMQQGPQGARPNRQGTRPQGQQPGGQPSRGGQQESQGQEGGAQAGMAQQQEELRRRLGDLMRQFGELGAEIPRPLGRAERAMREAEQALGQGMPGEAVPSQNQALDQLQQGLQSMQQQMQQAQGSGSQPMMRRQAGRQPGRDPLGRSMQPGNGQYNTDQVKIPTESDLQRAREILDELRRRSGEQNRPKLERDYIERLLERFGRP
ncbi:TIGR02302 family protein [Oleisolibacter albus]|uniref:TIGR02302 family protein n=1 Tax=Oleisolibacter albus TaxID=2171757 RepID=UPI000DF3AE21|nr:TIGR02302 family protein [Oleisolibacter albus]